MGTDMLAFHQRTGLAAIPCSAQAKGYFDKLSQGVDPATARLYDNAPNRAKAREPAVLAKRYTAIPRQATLAAMIRAPFVTIPAIGCRTPGQVASSFASLRIGMSQTEANVLLALPPGNPDIHQ